jgi:hypothetical protein
LGLDNHIAGLTQEECAENSKKDLKDYINSLRQCFFQILRGKVNIVVETERQNEKQVELSNGYIYTRSLEVEKGRSGIVDIAVDRKSGVEAFCCSSFDSIALSEGKLDHGEDAVGFFRVGNRVVLVEADGVSSSFMGVYASQGAIEAIINRGGENLVENTEVAGERLKAMHDSFQVPSDVSPMLRKVLQKKKDMAGSQTMLNQISVDVATGKVEGCFMGDGGFTVLRNDGTVRSFNCTVDANSHGDSNVRLSTLRGLIGTPAGIKDVAGEELVLGSGDVILLYSDGVTKNMVERIGEINKNGGDFKIEIPKMIESLRGSKEKDDDRSLLVFRMK